MARTRLLMPRSEAATKLRERIDKGEEIVRPNPRTGEDVHLATMERREQRWRDYNIHMLRAMFTTSEFAVEYKRSVVDMHPVKDSYIGPDEDDIRERLVRSITQQADCLASIRDRLELIGENVPAKKTDRKAETKKPATNTGRRLEDHWTITRGDNAKEGTPRTGTQGKKFEQMIAAGTVGAFRKSGLFEAVDVWFNFDKGFIKLNSQTSERPISGKGRLHDDRKADVKAAEEAASARRDARVAAKVFISYRRDDSAGSAGRVHDQLERELGRDLLFMDVDAIPLGVNFVKVIRDEVAKCDVLLAVIGPNWLDARDEHGSRRLDDPNDFLRIEIATALQRNIRVIPILVDGARIPKTCQLPEDLQELALRHGLDVRHASFRGDVGKLIRELRSQLNLGGSAKS